MEFNEQLIVCGNNDSHAHLPGQCPLCSIEATSSQVLFRIPRSVSIVAKPPDADLAALWLAITSVAAPGKRSPAPGPIPASSTIVAPVQPLVSGRSRFGQFLQRFGILGQSPQERERSLRAAALTQSTAVYDALAAKWLRNDGAANFAMTISTLSQIRNQLWELTREEASEALKLSAQASKLKFLAGFAISKASVEGIGPGRKAILEGRGIETAADVSPATLAFVPRLGPILIGRLLEWRKKLEDEFRRREGSSPMDPVQYALVVSKNAAKRTRLIGELRSGPADLRRIVEQARTAQELELAHLQTAASLVAQARANLNGL
jgi:DNA-binding helix-hairpin-helix protein with protein kinase domain